MGFNLKQVAGDPWRIRFLVELRRRTVSLSDLPEPLKNSINKAVGGLGPDMFSIQQLYIDLNTAVFDTFQNVDFQTGRDLAATFLTGIMKKYLADLQESGGIVFGTAVTSTKANAAPPTFMPTAIDYCITPYFVGGVRSNPGLDTLNYLCMVDHHVLPRETGKFNFNWIEDGNDQGLIAVKRDLWVPHLIGTLNAILKPLCPTCYVKATVPEDSQMNVMELRQGGDKSFDIVNPPQNGVIASKHYEDSKTDIASSSGCIQQVGLGYKSNCSVSLKEPHTVAISGAAIVGASSFLDCDPTGTGGGVGVLSLSMPETTYAWSVNLVLQMDPANNGQLDLAITNPSFNSPPSMAADKRSDWEKFGQFVSGINEIRVADMGDLRSYIRDSVLPGVKNSFASVLNHANDFVFPGNNTFLFKNPQFSAEKKNLIVNITYSTSS
jgi:hypothetical protein